MPRLSPDECPHERVVVDEFSKLVGVVRAASGDLVCLDCGSMMERDNEVATDE